MLLLFLFPLQFVCGQTQAVVKTPPPLEDTPFGPPSLSVDVEKVSGEFRLRVTNNDSTRKFQGHALVNLGTAYQQAEAGKLNLSIAPQETAIHLLYSMPAVGDQYTVVITDPTGVIVVHKIAPVRTINDPSLSAPPPTPVSTVLIKTEETIPLKVKIRLAGGTGENDPYMLAFELSSPQQITNGRLRISAKGLDESQPVSFVGKANHEFKLSEDLEVQKISYVVTGSRGEVLAKGETDLTQLMTEDVVTISGLKLDKQVYKPGEMAKLTVSYQGNVPNGIRVELTVTDHTGKVVFRDIRKEKKDGDLPTHEFSIQIPKDVSETMMVEYKVFDGDSQQIIDSAHREIPVVRS
ncbi:MAG TPA: hypothetical protein VFZ34_05495 [Blastocatellia bacterium]|nr:hypothetical protein [Blastocatellia bacterium]